MISLLYTSTASYLFSDDDIKEILNASHTYNNAHNLSGLLLYKEGNIIQVLEGEEEEVDFIFNKIKQDTRHRQLSVLIRSTITEREFEGWRMGFINIGNLTDEERASYSSFLNERSFDKKFLKSSPTRASILLSSFRQVMDR